MPVARGAGVDARSAFVVGLTGVVIALVVGGFMLYLSSRDDIQVRLGDDTFRDLDAESSAEEIAARGPLTFLDLAGGNRDIFVQHLGEDHTTGWYAFDVRPAGEPRECAVEWRADEQEFVDNGKCSTELVFPANGEGLPQYPAIVDDDGNVVIDLNAAQRASSTTTTQPTQTTQSQGS